MNHTIFNTQINSVFPTGAPFALSVPLTVSGEGFVLGMEGGRCSFTNAEAQLTVYTQVVPPTSSTEAVCNSPAGGFVRTYEVSVQMNGEADDPFMAGPLIFHEYDATLVGLAQLTPSGGPQGVAVPVTVQGFGFANYGPDQVVCASGSALAFGVVLNSTHMICTLPSTLALGNVAINISLDGGASFTDALDYYVYEQPTIDNIETEEMRGRRRVLQRVVPEQRPEGPSVGGTLVFITGKGFENFRMPAATPSCRFMGHGSTTSKAHVVSDTEIRCNTTWGRESRDGQPAAVALNSHSFTAEKDHTADEPVVFFFVGMHQPVLEDVYFSPVATTLVVKLDPQQTNRGSTNGNVNCNRFFATATVAVLQGDAPLDQPVECAFVDDSTINVYLTINTHAAPGMTVQLKAQTIWPKKFTGSCLSPGHPLNLCNPGTEMTVDPHFPCDMRATPTIERCVTPVAVIRAPTEIDPCQGIALELDGSASEGGGAKLLNFSWQPTLRADHRRTMALLLPLNPDPTAAGMQYASGASNHRTLTPAATILIAAT